jgi:iron(III) transport system ATP-binding protein
VNSLKITGVHKAFGANAVLRGVDLRVAAGSLTAILGPSGSGKTTLLRVIAGFEQADQGTVELGGVTIDSPAEFVASERRQIGYVPQEGSLFPHLTVRKNIAFGLTRRQRGGERVEELLAMIGMSGLGGRYPHQLSGGQQQRVALARALAVKPRLVLLDEPFSALDPALRAGVRADVRSLLRAAGTTAVLVTHDQDEALSIADEVAVIRDGRVGQCDKPQSVYDTPADTELATFVGEANLVDGTFAGGVVRTAFGELELSGAAHDSGPAVVLIRPEQLRLSADGSGFAATVLENEYHGHDCVLKARGALEQSVLVRVPGRTAHEVGAQIALKVDGPVVAWPARG